MWQLALNSNGRSLAMVPVNANDRHHRFDSQKPPMVIFVNNHGCSTLLEVLVSSRHAQLSSSALSYFAVHRKTFGFSGQLRLQSRTTSTLETLVSSRQGLSSAPQEEPGYWLMPSPKYYYYWLRHNLELEGCLEVT